MTHILSPILVHGISVSSFGPLISDLYFEHCGSVWVISGRGARAVWKGLERFTFLIPGGRGFGFFFHCWAGERGDKEGKGLKQDEGCGSFLCLPLLVQ